MRKLILFLSLILSVGFASAQSEVPSDSIRRAPSSNIKEFGGFLLDMGLMNVTPPKLPKFSLDVPDVSKDYNQIFRLNTDATYTQGFTDAFSSPFHPFFSLKVLICMNCGEDDNPQPYPYPKPERGSAGTERSLLTTLLIMIDLCRTLSVQLRWRTV